MKLDSIGPGKRPRAEFHEYGDELECVIKERIILTS